MGRLTSTDKVLCAVYGRARVSIGLVGTQVVLFGGT